tara:strand:+ start:122 stop:565 length:444 start_codon:yes stop_codon:yes gene_type:complete
MQSEFSVSAELVSNINKWFDLYSLDASEMGKAFADWKQKTCYTASGKPRYRLGYIRSLHSFYIAVSNAFEREHCIFGYWYESEFYTTYKGSNELTKKYNFKTTEILLNLKLDQKIWDTLPLGQYYAKNLKRFHGADHAYIAAAKQGN